MHRLSQILICALVCSFLLCAAGERAQDSSQFRMPLTPRAVDEAVLEASTRKFDSEEWKKSICVRQSMLLDLLRVGFSQKKASLLRSALGAPKWATKLWNQDLEYYDLGKFQSENLFLQVSYAEQKLWSMTLVQRSESGYLHLFPGEWQFKNPDPREFAEKLNHLYCLVGAPREHLCQFIGHPEMKNGVWHCGTIELEFTPDMKKVKRFRTTPDLNTAYKVTSAWQDKDLRKFQGSYSTAYDWLNVESPDTILFHSMGKLDLNEWKGVLRRRWMVCDMTQNFHIVGKRRGEVLSFLGEPIYSEKNIASEKKRAVYFKSRLAQPAPFNKFDWFPLCGTGCMLSAEPGIVLEVVYKSNLLYGDVADGYRVLFTDKDRDGELQVGGQTFTERNGVCQTLTEKPKSSQSR